MSGVLYPEFKYIETTVSEGVGTIRLNRPSVKNAFTPRSYQEVGDAVRLFDYDDGIDVIVIEGAGGNFSSGGDLSVTVGQLAQLDAGNPLMMYEYPAALPFEIVMRSSTVVIAKISGWCAGGGLMLAASCDVVIAAEDARFAVLEGKAGISDSLTYPLLTRRISPTKAHLMIYTGDAISGVEAERIGLVSLVTTDEQLNEQTTALIARIRQTTAEARAGYKTGAANALPVIPNFGPGVPFGSTEVHERLRRWAPKSPAS